MTNQEQQAPFQGSVILRSFGWLTGSPWSKMPEHFTLTRIRQAFYRAAMFSCPNPLRLVFKERGEGALIRLTVALTSKFTEQGALSFFLVGHFLPRLKPGGLRGDEQGGLLL